MTMILHDFALSSASYRVRIALNLKGCDYEPRIYNLRAGEHREKTYLSLNPQGLVPALEDNGHVLSQSLAIIEYLEEVYPDPPLLPADTLGRARVRSLTLSIACDVHPLNNLRVLQYLKKSLGIDEDAWLAWYHHWLATTFDGLETRLSDEEETGAFCHGDTPGLTDIFLVPQVYNAMRYEFDLSPYPEIRRINEACLELKPFADAHPDQQPT